MAVYLLLGLGITVGLLCVCVILITSAWTAPESDTGKSGLRLSWKRLSLEGVGMLQAAMVRPRMLAHLVADSRRRSGTAS